LSLSPTLPPQLHRLAAFTDRAGGGNPAGVWVDEALPQDEAMQRLAAAVGFSETAFLAPEQGDQWQVRYFSPAGEVPFCGHATIAAAVLLADTGAGRSFVFQTPVGAVPVQVEEREGVLQASLTSVEPRQAPASEALVAAAIEALGWQATDLDPDLPAVKAYAGAWHLVLAAATAERLARLQYAFEPLKALMLRENLLTLQLVWRQDRQLFHSRNPFPVGGVVEDPATGSAAAALGGYLRAAGLVAVPTTLLIRQGEAMGRPSQLRVTIPATGGIVVSGGAVRLP
jgi:PhzF family phenazine biosynthesis protein